MRATAWRDATYREVFDSCILGLEGRRGADSSFTRADAEGTLRHLYIQDGNDQGGRGELQDIILSAQIAAHEQFIAEWKAEDSARRGKE